MCSSALTSRGQFTGYCSTPLLLILQPSISLVATSDVNGQNLPFKAYEPTIELRDRKSRSVFIEVPYNVETGEAERIAVDWTARGGGSGTSCKQYEILYFCNGLTDNQWSRTFKRSVQR